MPSVWEMLAGMAATVFCVLLIDWWYHSPGHWQRRAECDEHERELRLHAAFREAVEKLDARKPTDEPPT